MAKDKLKRSDAFASILSGTQATVSREEVRTLALGEITPNPEQPRKYFDEASLEQLASSIRDKGVLQPVLVRDTGATLELVAGERRYQAAKRAGLETIPAIVRELSDEQALEIALTENLSREDLSPVEETDSTLRLLSARLDKPVSDVIEVLREGHYKAQGRPVNTGVNNRDLEVVEQLFTNIGRFTVSSFYTHRLPILKLPEDLLEVVRRGDLEYSKARLLARVNDAKKRASILKKVIEKGWSRTKIQDEIKALNEKSDGQQEGLSLDVSSVKRKLSSKQIAQLPAAKQRKLEKLLVQINSLFEGSRHSS